MHVCVCGVHTCMHMCAGVIYIYKVFVQRPLCVSAHASLCLYEKALHILCASVYVGPFVHVQMDPCAQHLCDLSGLQVSLCAPNPAHWLLSECRLCAHCRMGGQQAGGTLLRKSIHKDLVGWALPSCLPFQAQATATASYIRAVSRA